VGVSSTVSKSGSKSLSCLRSLAYASSLTHCALGRGVWIYTYLGGTPSIVDRWAASLLLGGTSRVSGGCGVGSGVGCLSRSGGCAPVPLHLQRVCGFCAVPLWQGRQPSVRLFQSMGWWLSIAAVTVSCPGNWTLRFYSSRTSAQGLLIRNCVSSIVARKNPPLTIVAIFKARRMSDCSSCTRPPCLAIVADMFKTYKKLVAASTYWIRPLLQPYTLPSHHLLWLKPVWSSLRDPYHYICPCKSQSWQPHDIRFGGLCG